MLDGLPGVLAAITAGASTVILVVTLIRGAVPGGKEWSNAVIDGVALAVGVGYCVLFFVDITPAIFALTARTAGEATRLHGLAGQIATGVIFGAAATFGAKFLNALGAFQVHRQAEAWSLAGGPTTTPRKPTTTPPRDPSTTPPVDHT